MEMLEMKFDNQVFKCYIMKASMNLNMNTDANLINNDFEKRFLTEFVKNIEDDYLFFTKIGNREITDGIEDVGEIPRGVFFMAVYDQENNFIGKINISRKDYDFRLNIMYIYACNKRRLSMEEKNIKNYTKTSVIIWSFAALYSKNLYGKFARILIPLPRSIIHKRLFDMGCVPILIEIEKQDFINADISKKNTGNFTRNSINSIKEEGYISSENYGMIFIPSDLI